MMSLASFFPAHISWDPFTRLADINESDRSLLPRPYINSKTSSFPSHRDARPNCNIKTWPIPGRCLSQFKLGKDIDYSNRGVFPEVVVRKYKTKYNLIQAGEWSLPLPAKDVSLYGCACPARRAVESFCVYQVETTPILFRKEVKNCADRKQAEKIDGQCNRHAHPALHPVDPLGRSKTIIHATL